ncbi:hypothetical protein WR25_19548 [Diploscapter pachys]|uniref:ubiquitinyl hydrolase 1 n=1 Tax=Diploscapter pachys TaxID=2018661 RepID=A0A2A2JEX8_9BILA|nr:hypothetical protein WR25_19548 [Diploscapter pachys]
MSTDFHRSHAPKPIHYYSPHNVYPPQISTKSPISNFDRAAPSRTRVIPIERKDSPKSLSNSNSSFSPASSSHASLQPYYDRPNNGFDLLTNDGIPNPRTGGEQFENDIRNWNGGSSLRRRPSAEPEHSSFGRRDHSDNRSKEDIVRERRISGPGDQRRSREDEKSTNRETMLRSQSKSRLTASQLRDISYTTISVDDPMLTQRVSVGDRCIWSGHPCTVRFIGYLKGHASIYAGVEFDDKVGKGTGAFEGETVFRAPDGHAGFVILSALEKLNDVPNSHDSRPPPPYHQVAPSKPEDFLINGLDIGSRVSANYVGAIRSGTVKWIGDSMSDERDRIMKCAVVQLDSEPPSGWRLASDDPDLSINFSEPRCVILPYNPQTLKACPTGSGSNGSNGDVEMADASSNPFSSHHQEPERVDFGNLDSDVQLTKVYPTRNKEDLIGRMRGIQGHRNSCYLDSMLFAMFSQTTVYDHLLDRIPRSDDVPQLKELQRILATEIVYPLRKSHYVRADHVMKVRELLQSILPNMKGLTTEEKDPEEIINEVFGKIFKAPPAVRFIKDNKIDSMHICPIIVEEWSQGIVTTQHLLERHMVASNVRFAEPPKTLIIQLPRYGQQKLFDKILPLESINITPLVDRATVKCGFCDSPAVVHCPECYLCNRVFLSEVSYCKSCFHKHIEHKEFADHLPHPYKSSSKKPHNYRMSLTAVLCIETSHYVSFVRTLSGEWVFFDSMADREGYSNGYNVPIVKQCEGISYWLSNDAWKRLRNADEQQVKQIFGRGSTEADPLVCRMLSDSYFCFYEEEPYSPKSMASSSSSNSLLSVFKKNSS